MSGAEVAALVVALTCGVALTVLIVAVVQLLRTVREIRAAVGDLQREAAPTLADMRDTVDVARSELERVDGLLDTAEAVSGRVDGASRLAYRATANPVIKVMAAARGGREGWRRWRGRDRTAPGAPSHEPRPHEAPS